MKLTRLELTHATDKQLERISVYRKNNAGWLKKAMRMNFKPETVEAFKAADTRFKCMVIIPNRKEENDLFDEFREMFTAGRNCRYYDRERMREVVAKIDALLKEGPKEGSPEDYANSIFENNRLEFTELPDRPSAHP